MACRRTTHLTRLLRPDKGGDVARRTIIVSDLTGKEIDASDAATITIRYADARRGQVQLDVNASEVEDLARKGTRSRRGVGDDRSPADSALPFRPKTVDLSSLDAGEARAHVAVHEAGHAVAGYTLDLPLIGIEPGDLTPVHVAGGLGLRLDSDALRCPWRRSPELHRRLHAWASGDGPLRWTLCRAADPPQPLARGLGGRHGIGEEVLRLRTRSHRGLGGGRKHCQTVLLGCIREAYELVSGKEPAVRRVAEAVARTGRLSAVEIAEIVRLSR